MAQANSFSHIGAACVRVLARQAAINAVKSELQRQGLRVHVVPMRDIHIQADEYLRQHPELIPQAEERAQHLGLIAHKSKHLSKTERPVNRAFPLSGSYEQNLELVAQGRRSSTGGR
jgi:hypothetical protein